MRPVRASPDALGDFDYPVRRVGPRPPGPVGPVEAYVGSLTCHVSQSAPVSAGPVRENGVVTEDREPTPDLPRPGSLGPEPTRPDDADEETLRHAIERFRRAIEHASPSCDEAVEAHEEASAARARWFPRLEEQIAEATQAHVERRDAFAALATPGEHEPGLRRGGRGAGPRPEAPRRAHPPPGHRTARRIHQGVHDRIGATRRGGRAEPRVAPRRQRRPPAARRLARRRVGSRGRSGRRGGRAGGDPTVPPVAPGRNRCADAPIAHAGPPVGGQ